MICYLGDYLGYLGIMTDAPHVNMWNQYGYPIEFPFTGETLVKNFSTLGFKDYVFGEPPMLGVGSPLTQGASGGPWIYESYVNGINSYLLLDCRDTVFSPYFDNVIWDRFQEIKNASVPTPAPDSEPPDNEPPPQPPPEEPKPKKHAYVRFQNSLTCGGNKLRATLRLCNNSFTAGSGKISPCTQVSPQTCDWKVSEDSPCPSIAFNERTTLNAGWIYDFRLNIDEQGVFMKMLGRPGDCSSPVKYKSLNQKDMYNRSETDGEWLIYHPTESSEDSIFHYQPNH